MIKGVTHAHLGPIWYHSEPSNVPYSPNQFLGWDFFAASYSKTALKPFLKIDLNSGKPKISRYIDEAYSSEEFQFRKISL